MTNKERMQKRLAEMVPDEVLAEVRDQIRKYLGDQTENKTRIWTSHGYYYLALPYEKIQSLRLKRKGLRSQWNGIAIRRKAFATFFEQMAKIA